MLRTASRAMEPKASEVFTWDMETTMMYPNPWLDPTNSPITAPITARVMATFSPTKIWGMALGKRTFRKIWVGVAHSDRTRFSISGGAEFSPAAVPMTMGKKQTRKTMRILGNCPYPTQTSRMGATATLGTDWRTRRRGYTVRSRNRDETMSTPMGTPRAMERA